ncbi:hemicentin-1-like [Pectinophora gossypiella]|uniref:hemicentin-1-like n=1 Tax=Pectinophora gossypiella TaxID=13191 RepID=UPI00214EBB68|nr:hemicentin-1-like [Pectinophora gossypiella]
MHLNVKLFVIFLHLAICLGKKSFTILLDTTLSMQEEIDIIKRNIGTVVNVLKSTDVENYVLVPFNDPEVGPPIISSNAEELVASLNRLTVSGGHDCPEDSLAGIQKALEVSNAGSTVFVFTDAYAKDNSKLEDIRNLCRNTSSQVIIFLSGRCVPETQGGSLEVYFQIARACSGGVYRLEPAELRRAFYFMKEIMLTEWTEITTMETFTNYKELMIPIDSSTTGFILAIYGDNPQLRIYNRSGHSPEVEKIIDTRHSLVVRLTNLQTEEYRALIRCRTLTAVTIYRRNEFPFQCGFSTRMTKNLKETSSKPMPGWTNYMLIVLPESSTVKLKSVELTKINTNDKTQLILDQNEDGKQLYTTSAFFEPETLFRISVTGEDPTKSQDIRGSTKILETQKSAKDTRWISPTVEIMPPDNTVVEFNQSITIVCKVIGYPKPAITWEDDNNTALSAEDVLLEIPSIHLSYLTIDNFSKNMTIYCKAKNAEAEDQKSLELFVNKPFSFDVKQTPADETIEYASEGKLYCEADVYPDATTTWYHNDTVVYGDKFDNIEIRQEDHVLIIKYMSLADTGEYKCEIKNEYETRNFTALVSISGLKAPQIEIEKSEIILKPGDWTEIECKTEGKPTPEIAWKFQSENADLFNTITEGAYLEGKKLKIPSVKSEHTGTYRCEASNIVGQDYRDIVIKIQYEPVVKVKEETLVVREGDMVEIECEVDAMPEARVRWEMSQDDVIMMFDGRHTTDDHHTHRFEALWKDSGNYHCIAENDLGRVEKSVTVNVLVAPYIKTPEKKTVTAKLGSTVTLTCNVLFGNPVPSTKWEFKPPNTTTSVLSRGNSTSALHLTNITKQNEGSYICIADNDVGSDTVRIYLNVE